jgi:hypothetical protein
MSDKDTSEWEKTSVGIFGMVLWQIAQETSLNINIVTGIPTELIKAGSRTIRHEIHKLIISIWNKEELPEEWKESIIVPLYKKGDRTECSNLGAYHFCELRGSY